MTPTLTGNRPIIAVAWAFLAAALFSMQDALVKWLAVGLPLFQLMFVRALIAVPLMWIVMRVRYGPGSLRTRKPLEHSLRALTNISAFLCHYYAVSRMPLADAVAISLSAPLFVTALSGLVLREPADFKRKVALAIGFLGMLFVVQPTGEVDWVGVGAAILGSILFATLAIWSRYLSVTESTELMVFYGASGFLIVTGVTMPFVWQSPSGWELGLMIALSLISLSAQFSTTHSFRFAPVYVVAPVEYVVIIWAVFFGWVLFGQLPTFVMLLGAAIVIGGGLYIVQLERGNFSKTH